MADKSLTLGTVFTANVEPFLAGLTRIRQGVTSLNASFKQQGMQAPFTQAAKGVDKLGKSLDKTTKKAVPFNKQIGKIEGALQRVIAAMKVTASYGLAASAIFTVTRAFREGITEIINYDQALKNLQAITQSTDAEVLGMGQTIQEVAKTTKFSTGEVAEGMVLLGQAGFSATEAMQAMQSVADLATGTLSDMKTVTDLVTTTVRAFGLESVESARVADVMSNAINRSKLTIDKLRIAFNFVGAAAAQTGLTLEETAASMMLLANNGLRASTIGTGLRQVLSRLLAPNRNLREEFEAQGIELSRVNPKLQGFQDAMRNLLPIVVNMESKTVDMAKAYRLFGLRGAQALAVLARGFATGAWDNMYEKTLQVGTAAEMAAKQMEGLGVKLKNLADRLLLIAVAFGEAGVTDVLKGIIDALRTLASWIADFVKSDIGRLIASFGVWTLTMTVVTKAVLALVVALTKLKTALLGLAIVKFVKDFAKIAVAFNIVKAASWALSGALAGAVPPFFAVGAAIAAVVAGVKFYLGITDRAVKETIKLQQEAVTASTTLKVYAEVFDELREKQEAGKDITKEHAAEVKRLGEAYKPLKGVLDESAEALDKNAAAIHEAFRLETLDAIQKTVDLIKLYDKQTQEAQRRTGFWKVLWADVKADFRSIWGFFTKIGDGIIWIIEKIIQGLIKFDEWVRKLANTVRDKLGNIFPIFKQINKALEGNEGWWARLMKRIDEYGAKSKKVQDINKNQQAAFVQLATLLKELGYTYEQVIAQIEALTGKKIGEELAKEISKMFEESVFTLQELEKKMENAFKDLPSVFKDIFDKLGPIQRGAFAKMKKSMDSEIAAIRTSMGDMGIAVKEIESTVMSTRARMLVDFVAKQNKEKMTAEERYAAELQMLADFERAYIKHYDERIRITKEGYAEMIKETGDPSKVIDLQKAATAKILQFEKQKAEAIAQIQNARLYAYEQREIEASKRVERAYKETSKKIVSDLKKRYNSLIKEAQKFNTDRVKFEQDVGDKIRKLQERGLTDEQKFRKDISEIDDLRRKARITKDKQYYEKAAELAEGLAREVKDSHGKIIQTEEEGAKRAIRILENVQEEGSRMMLIWEKNSLEKAATVKKSWEDIEKAVESYNKKLDEVSKKKLTLDVEEAIQRLRKTENRFQSISKWLKKIIDQWKQVKQLVLTTPIAGAPTVKKAEGDSEAVEDVNTRVDRALKDFYEDIDNARKGGLVLHKPSKSTHKTTSLIERYREGGEVDRTKLINNVQKITHLREGGKVERSEIINSSKFINRLKEGGTIDRVKIINSLKDRYRYGGKVEKVSVIDRLREGGKVIATKVVNRIFDTRRFKEGGRVKHSKVLRDSRHTVDKFREGGSVERLSTVNNIRQVRETLYRRLGGIADNVLQFAKGGAIERHFEKTDKFKEGGKVVSLKTVNNIQRTRDTLRSQSEGVRHYREGGKVTHLKEYKRLKEGGKTERTTVYHKFKEGARVATNKFLSKIEKTKEIVRRRAGGWSRKIMDRGGRLGGYGGGDRVKILAEPGEYVVRKEAVKKYGEGTFHNLNSMKFSAPSVDKLNARMGGFVKSFNKIQRLKEGGIAERFVSPSTEAILTRRPPAQKIEINLKPTFMTGDRRSAKQTAIEIKKIMENLNTRWGM